MSLEKIKKLAVKGESEKLEFKKSTTQLKATAESFCGFLNHNGGMVIIGITEKGNIVGQHVTDQTRQEIANELNKFEPLARIKVEFFDLKNTDKKIIMLTAPYESHSVPYTYDGRAYQRRDSITIKMPQSEYQQRLIEKMENHVSWDSIFANEYDISMLDHDEIKRAVKQGITANRIPVEAAREDVETVLKRFKLIKNNKILNAAVVLFAKDMTPLYSHCLLKMARFAGNDKLANFLDNKQIEGNAFKLLEVAETFVREHLRIVSAYQENSFERIDTPTLPVLAVREALINAIVHRDYSEGSGAISLAIFDDRLELWNYGRLPSALNIESLKENDESLPRNKLIAKIFYLRRFVEQWGTGIQKILDACLDAELPEPEFIERSGGFCIIFKFRESLSLVKTKSILMPMRVAARQQEILNILSERGQASLTEILQSMPKGVHERLIRNDLYALKKIGKVETKGRGRGAIWSKLK